jgi:hypothetical protein
MMASQWRTNMIDFKPKWKRSGYCLRLKGNGIEEELIAITSWGQDRKSSLVIVSATVDAGLHLFRLRR